MVKAVRDGESDVGIAFQPLPERNVLSAHEFADPLCVIAAPGSSMANLNQASLIEALRHPVALPTETFGIRALINARCAELKLLPEPALETNSIEALRGFARSGAGLTMLPYLSAKRDVDMGLLVALPFTDPRCAGPPHTSACRKGAARRWPSGNLSITSPRPCAAGRRVRQPSHDITSSGAISPFSYP